MSNHSFASAISGPLGGSVVGGGQPFALTELGSTNGVGVAGSSSAPVVSTVGSGGAGPQTSSLAALHYESQSLSTRTTMSNLWAQLKQRIPELRNVTQYYAAEVQRYGATLLSSSAVKAAGEAFQQSLPVGAFTGSSGATGGELISREEESPPPGSGRSPNAGPRGDGASSAEPPPVTVDSSTRTIGLLAPEVHYQPNPLGALRIAVHSTAIETLPSGEVYLLMSIETGFAAFEVTPQGVFELVVDLNVATSLGAASPNAQMPFTASTGQQPTRVVGLKALTKDVLIVVTTSSIAAYFIPARAFSRPMDLPFTASSLALMVSQTTPPHAVVGCSEFAQYCIYEISGGPSGGDFQPNPSQPHSSGVVGDPLSHSYSQISPCSELYSDDGQRPTGAVAPRGGSATPLPHTTVRFREVVSICADRAVCATSARWFAYSGMCEHPQVATEFTAQRDETPVESVTRSVMTGLNALTSNLWSTPPGPQPSVVALGTVVIYDVAARAEISGFVAHQHPLQCMKFDRTGTLLATASTAGTTISVFQVLPTYEVGGYLPDDKGATDSPRSAAPTFKMGTAVTLLYRLSRGLTQCIVTDIQFGPLAAWVALCTGVGTCHMFHIPEEHRNAYGRKSRTKAAPSITAGGRARSAWSSTSVNPQVAFRPVAAAVAQGQVTSVDVFLVSGSGTVTALRFSSEGVAVYWSRSIDQFSGERPSSTSRPNSAGTPSATPRPASAGADFVPPLIGVAGPAGRVASAEQEEEAAWRAEIELVTHPEGFGGVECSGPVTGLPMDDRGVTRLNAAAGGADRHGAAPGAPERSDGDDWDVA